MENLKMEAENSAPRPRKMRVDALTQSARGECRGRKFLGGNLFTP